MPAFVAKSAAAIYAFAADLFAMLSAATAAAHAVEVHRKPRAADLRTLGIAPADFTVKL